MERTLLLFGSPMTIGRKEQIKQPWLQPFAQPLCGQAIEEHPARDYRDFGRYFLLEISFAA